MYSVNFTPAATRMWRKLPLDVREQVAPEIDALTKDPRPSGVAKLKGFKNIYRVRSGDYRVIYEVDDAAMTLWITKIAHRSEAY